MPSHREPRVAFLPDSFPEINGVAHTARQFTAWAAHTGRPSLCVYGKSGGDRGGNIGKGRLMQQGELQMLELPRGFASFALDKDLRYDLLFARHGPLILETLRAFRPDIIHITGPSELGMLGALFARRLGVPLAASWHTNVHEYAARRSWRLLRALPPTLRPQAAARIERGAFRATARFYQMALVLFAPNPELCALLAHVTGRPCRLMPRGVDAQLFSPTRRTAPAPGESGVWTFGYVGRLSVEKNVALLARVAATLRQRGIQHVRFLIVGQGLEEPALRLALPNAVFTGVLRGEALAEAYANMDCFLFPSHTDTFGNVVLEAMASGVPAIVTPDGGPAHLVRASEFLGIAAGIIAADENFAAAVEQLLADRSLHATMRRRARAYAEEQSWDAVFEGVYAGYTQALAPGSDAGHDETD
jgi:phosphatidylinositol alpha 1,6-mannosyltransferase